MYFRFFHMFFLVCVFERALYFERGFINLNFSLALPAFHLQFGNLYILNPKSAHKCVDCTLYDFWTKLYKWPAIHIGLSKKQKLFTVQRNLISFFLHFLSLCLPSFLSLSLFFFCHFFFVCHISFSFLHPYFNLHLYLLVLIPNQHLVLCYLLNCIWSICDLDIYVQ